MGMNSASPHAGNTTVATEALLVSITSVKDVAWYQFETEQGSIFSREDKWPLRHVERDDVWLLEGNFCEDDMAGAEFLVRTGRLATPTGSLLVPYLTRHCFPIGLNLANWLWHRYGKNLGVILEEGLPRSTNSAKAPFFPDDLRARIARQWMLRLQLVREINRFASVQVSRPLATRIFDAYGPVSFDKVAADPYRLTGLMGFECADCIAKSSFGLLRNDPRRLGALVLKTVERAPGQEGIKRDLIAQDIGKTCDADEQTASVAIDTALSRGLVLVDADGRLVVREISLAHQYLKSFLSGSLSNRLSESTRSGRRKCRVHFAESETHTGMAKMRQLFLRLKSRNLPLAIATSECIEARQTALRLEHEVINISSLHKAVLAFDGPGTVVIDRAEELSVVQLASVLARLGQVRTLILLCCPFQPNERSRYSYLLDLSNPCSASNLQGDMFVDQHALCEQPICAKSAQRRIEALPFNASSPARGLSTININDSDMIAVATGAFERLRGQGTCLMLAPTTSHVIKLNETLLKRRSTRSDERDLDLHVGDPVRFDRTSPASPAPLKQIGFVHQILSPPVRMDGGFEGASKLISYLIKIRDDLYGVNQHELSDLSTNFAATIEQLPGAYPASLVAVLTHQVANDANWVFRACMHSSVRLIAIGSTEVLDTFLSTLRLVRTVVTLPILETDKALAKGAEHGLLS
ncbi:Helix-hairpin-helix containing domain-containing protein [Paraburkholderia phenazinium]|uniref:Helix-hairpin-helix containing domain-containing protein n=1 Tax=Paraburkholderia phenazinium TaxID=60549 RepID=A0A1G7WQE7_9BURK|nr:helix-hairpin-helix domain-containing protein [Paraburkholderia phenazinium]SDG74181.1 Helix-hairpin-helix containing domain-containing protein [Paraburkholderia phenazinium]